MVVTSPMIGNIGEQTPDFVLTIPVHSKYYSLGLKALEKRLGCKHRCVYHQSINNSQSSEYKEIKLPEQTKG